MGSYQGTSALDPRRKTAAIPAQLWLRWSSLRSVLVLQILALVAVVEPLLRMPHMAAGSGDRSPEREYYRREKKRDDISRMLGPHVGVERDEEPTQQCHS